MAEEYTEYNLPVDAYATFDATSLRDLVKTNLIDKGVFTDQIFEGSNLSSLIDVIAYSYHTLLFYLNRTSNEGMHTNSEIYENINRIVKALSYDPVGYQTAVQTFKAIASGTISKGLYTIPRYTFINAGGVRYSINNDISFTKTVDVEETIQTIGLENLLYQGSYKEYPLQRAIGEPYEQHTIALPSTVKMDYNNIDVYVKSVETGLWSQYNEVASLFLSQPDDLSFEKRLNHNERIEIKFGNNVNGKQLKTGDQIAIYYIESDGEEGQIGAGALDSSVATLYTSVQFSAIRKDIKPANLEYMSFDDITKMKFRNTVPSTSPVERESVESIRRNAPVFYKAQGRLMRTTEYESFVNKNFGNILSDAKVISNKEYLNGHLAYLVNTLKLQNPNKESRVLYNQVRVATSVNFNNIYVYAVPRVEIKTSASILANYLAPAQKELIINGINASKVTNNDVAIIDPVYMAVDIATPGQTGADSISDARVVITRSSRVQRNSENIKTQVFDVMKSIFSVKNSKLGQLIDIQDITNQILSINGVTGIVMTTASNPQIRVDGLSLLLWNPVYPEQDTKVITQNTQLQYFKYPYLYDESSLRDKILVEVDNSN